MNCEIPPKSIFELYMMVLKTSIDVLEEKYHSDEVNDIKSYQVIILKRIYKSMSTLEVMLSQCQDPISSYGLLRTIVDSICSYCFIYDNDDNEEVEFRHYLYILDGCSKYNDLYHFYVMNHQAIKEKDILHHEEEIKNNTIETQNIQNGIIKLLKQHSYMHKSPRITETIIKNADWKYISINNDVDKNYYNWKGLYEKVGFDERIVEFISKYLSQFVHGLFLSNSKNPNSIVHYSIFYELLVTMIRYLMYVIYRVFKDDDICENTFRRIDFDKIANNDSIKRGDLMKYIMKEFHQQ